MTPRLLAPHALRLQTQGSYPDSISRWGIVEVAAAFGLALPALGAVAVATLAGPLDLGGGPLQRGARQRAVAQLQALGHQVTLQPLAA
jgi:hypothetical protein